MVTKKENKDLPVDNIISVFAKNKNVWIYGCSDNGFYTYIGLKKKGITVSGFLDTYKKGIFEGIEITDISKIDWNKDYVIISSSAWREIGILLENRGAKYLRDYLYFNENVEITKACGYGDLFFNQLVGSINNVKCQLRLGGEIRVE